MYLTTINKIRGHEFEKKQELYGVVWREIRKEGNNVNIISGCQRETCRW